MGYCRGNPLLYGCAAPSGVGCRLRRHLAGKPTTPKTISKKAVLFNRVKVGDFGSTRRSRNTQSHNLALQIFPGAKIASEAFMLLGSFPRLNISENCGSQSKEK
jgi:hypothetical protein